MSSYYAVAAGYTCGIFLSWSECNSAVKGFKGAIFKKFKTREEADAFLRTAMTAPIVCIQKAGHEAVGAMAEAVDIYVYTDGACSNNGRPGAVAGIGVFFGEADPRNVSRPLEAAAKQTNNTAELAAILAALDAVRVDLEAGRRICVVSDSEYSIRCATSYGAKQAAIAWKTEIPNMALVRRLYEAVSSWPTGQVRFMHILSHLTGTDAHSVGNAGADRLANLAIGLEECPYKEKGR